MGIKEKKNATQGEEAFVICSRCQGRTTHSVIVSFDKYGDDGNLEWEHHYQVVRCLGCKEVSFRDCSFTSDDHVQLDHDTWDTILTEKIYPPRLEGRKGLGENLWLLPHDTKRMYEETHQALLNGSPVLSGIGLRALVETVCRERAAQGRTLEAQIDNLVEQRILTPAGASILHKIRSMGNAAAHEVKPHSADQLSLAMNVVENLLREVYILPELVKRGFPE